MTATPVPDDARALARRLLAEDGERDLTTELLPDPTRATRGIIRVEDTALVAAGLAYAAAVGAAAGCASTTWETAEGDLRTRGEALGTIAGSLAAVLRAERPLLNVLQRACGIATLTRAFVDALEGTRCRVLHTRKTAPGLRALDVAAVVAGGGHEHRLGLDRAVMVKDNHWSALGDPRTELRGICRQARALGVQAVYVEVEDADQVAIACEAGASRLLIDNQPSRRFSELAQQARRLSRSIELEATGGITLSNVRAYAEAGADYVSVGALTHSVTVANIGIELAPA
ncbi:MAG TPA: carboxylating nicotinate-nucleotide diphosphorylase [Gemmatimonadales bacterium]